MYKVYKILKHYFICTISYNLALWKNGLDTSIPILDNVSPPPMLSDSPDIGLWGGADGMLGFKGCGLDGNGKDPSFLHALMCHGAILGFSQIVSFPRFSLRRGFCGEHF